MIHAELEADVRRRFAGASAIERRYRERYPTANSLSLRFIGRTLSKHGLATLPKVRRKGVSRYLHYPESLINGLGDSLLEVDFIGKKFLTGRTQPLNFIAFSLRFPRKLKHFQRIAGETAQEVIPHLERFFKLFEKPAVVKLDNGFAFAGAGPEPRTLNSVVLYLLQQRINPVFIAPRTPWNQASVEGSNSIFTRKFWNWERYRSIEHVDQRLVDFNKAYAWYTGYKKPDRTPKRRFVPKVYFIRKVFEDPKTKWGYIDILKEQIPISKSYINYFILAEWNLKLERLNILFERNQQPKQLKSIIFKLNPAVKAKLVYFH
ncbi:MAG: hypothetical protein WBD36_15285 [Bacteroidota bacterium]